MESNAIRGDAPTPDDAALIRLLQGASLFGAFAADDLAACARRFREMRFGKGELLFSRGDPGSSLYVVAEGQVRLAVSTAEGRELSFEIVGPGGMFGEIALLDGGARSAEATALAPTLAHTLAREDFKRLMRERPHVTEAVIAFLCARLRRVSDRLEDVALHPLIVRLARFLVVAVGDRRAPPGKRVPVELRFSQSELALLLGASRPKINATLVELERAGAIGRTSDRLFCDRDKLIDIAELSGPLPDA
jgi:CRP/FNR family cyclic AMP-dependent transcriptional regulator